MVEERARTLHQGGGLFGVLKREEGREGRDVQCVVRRGKDPSDDKTRYENHNRTEKRRKIKNMRE